MGAYVWCRASTCWSQTHCIPDCLPKPAAERSPANQLLDFKPLLVQLPSLLPLPPLCSWAKAICLRHGAAIQTGGSAAALPALRSLQKALTRVHEDLAATCEANQYALEYITTAGQDAEEQQQDEEPQERQQQRRQQQANGTAAANGGQHEEEEDSEMEDASEPSSDDDDEEEEEDSDE